MYFSTSNDPFENLALENQLLLNLNEGERQLLLYVNDKSIVMGRFQNPWIESDMAELRAQEVSLVRRQSGGGCVYHDPGNLNFCFLYGDRDYQKDFNNKFMQELLKNFDIDTIINERSDLVLNLEHQIFKFSGSAFKQKKDRSFHHCTMLIDSDLSSLKKLLNSPLKNLKTKSIASRPVPVKNLTQVNDTITIEQVVEKASEHSVKFEKIHFEPTDDYHEKLKSWDWVLGETPLFEIELKLGEELITLELRKATIINTTASNMEIQEILNRLKGLSIKTSEIQNILKTYGKIGELLITKLKEKQLI